MADYIIADGFSPYELLYTVLMYVDVTDFTELIKSPFE